MADFSNNTVQTETVSKGVAKRKYLLLDEDLEYLKYQLKDNPVNKSYAAMKIFKLSEVESVAIRKWGSMEKLEAEQEKRKQQNSKLERKNEEEKRHFWDHEEIFKPLEHFMVNLELPEERVSCYFREKIDDVLEPSAKDESLIDCDVILCFCDCLHNVPPDFTARRIFKEFPEARHVDKETPYNERRKMGHFSWTISKSLNKLIVNFYVVHKWKRLSQRQASTMINFDALSNGLRRFSSLLSKTLKKNGRQPNSLLIGTYAPYRVNSEKFTKILSDNMEHPVRIFTNVRKLDAKTSK